MIESIIINGAILGGIYALLALGFTLIYGVSGVINLAHGAFFMLGAFVFSVFGAFMLSVLGPFGVPTLIPLVCALVLAAIFVGAISSIVHRLTIHPILGDDIAIMVVTVGLALIFQQLMLIVFGTSSAPVPSLVSGFVDLWGVRVVYIKLLSFALSLGLFFGLWIFITKSKIGKAMMAVSQDREVAMLMGINTERLYMLTMAISAAFATLAGIFIASALLGGQASAYMWLHPLFISFAIVVLGGLGSVKGTLIGGFIIAYSEHIVANLPDILAKFVPDFPATGQIVTAVPIVIMVLIIVIRPKGLFGKRIEME